MTSCRVFPYGTALSLWRVGSRAWGFQSVAKGFQSTGVPECGEGVPEHVGSRAWVSAHGAGVPERGGSRVQEVPERAGSAVAPCGLTCSSAQGVFLDQDRAPAASVARRFSAPEPPGKPQQFSSLELKQ